MVENIKVVATGIDTVKPPRSGPSDTALRLRSLPEGVPAQGENFLELLVKINDIFMGVIIIISYLPL